jgi:hypothetical protein
MDIDEQYIDKIKDLEAIFEIAYQQGLPLSGENGAIALAQTMSRSAFYLIPESVRETVRLEVEARIDAEREAEKQALEALRLQTAHDIERRALKFSQTMMTELEKIIEDEDEGGFTKVAAIKEYLNILRNNITPEYTTEPLDDDGLDLPRLPAAAPITRLPLLAPDDPITEFTATAASGAKVTITAPDHSTAVDGQIINRSDSQA